MTNKQTTNRDAKLCILFHFLKNGASRILVSPLLSLLTLAALVSVAVLGRRLIGGLPAYYVPAYSVAGAIIVLLGVLALLLLLGVPRGMRVYRSALTEAGIVNKAGDTPILISRTDERNDYGIYVTTAIFDAVGVPISDWEEKRDAIETALNCYIVSVAQGKRPYQVTLKTVPGDRSLPEIIPWDETYMTRDNTLILGMGYAGVVSYNVDKTPHTIIGGSTGSGKSIEVRLLCYQALRKGFRLAIIDLKGGLDYAPFNGRCNIKTTEEEVDEYLKIVVDELEWRKRTFANNGSANIGEFNQKNRTHLKHILIVCDELAELTDVKAMSKEQKERLNRIVGYISTIARLGRAFGIYLVLATQRPDAAVLPGQIKNNCDLRLCSRADNVLSQIVLDNTLAADLIPKDAQGLFVLPDGTLFRGIYVTDDQIKQTKMEAKEDELLH